MGFFFNGKCSSTARLDGKVVIVTGSNNGIGKVTAADLAKRGAEVVMACRNLEKAGKAMDDIKKENSEAKLVLMKLDLSSLSSVRQFCEEFKSKYQALHLLINNAGIFEWNYSLSEDGYESHFATNYLGHFLLTLLLLPIIIKSTPARIVNVASMAYAYCNSMYFEDINMKTNQGTMACYARSKLATVLFTLELSKRLKDKEIIVTCLHPGVVDTNIVQQYMPTSFPGVSWLYSMLARRLMKTPEQGAQTTLHCALDEKIKTGCYYDDCVLSETAAIGKNEELAKALWDESFKICKLDNYDPFA